MAKKKSKIRRRKPRLQIENADLKKQLEIVTEQARESERIIDEIAQKCGQQLVKIQQLEQDRNKFLDRFRAAYAMLESNVTQSAIRRMSDELHARSQGFKANRERRAREERQRLDECDKAGDDQQLEPFESGPQDMAGKIPVGPAIARSNVKKAAAVFQAHRDRYHDDPDLSYPDAPYFKALDELLKAIEAL